MSSCDGCACQLCQNELFWGDTREKMDNQGKHMKQFLKHIDIELKLGGYNVRTIKTYKTYIKEYLEFKGRDYDQIDIFNIKEFIVSKFDRGQSQQTINLYLNAIRFFYKDIIGLEKEIKIKLPKKPVRLPIWLTRDELNELFGVVSNPKHRLIFQLTYGCGLRISDVLQIRVTDIDLVGKSLSVGLSENKTARVIKIPTILVDSLRVFIEDQPGSSLVFKSQMGGALTERGVQQAFSNCMKKTSIEKKASVHSLRHSYAIHLLEMGVASKYIERLLGVNNSRTMHVYRSMVDFDLHNVISPLDTLDFL